MSLILFDLGHFSIDCNFDGSIFDAVGSNDKTQKDNGIGIGIELALLNIYF